MIKAIGLLQRKEGMSKEEFAERWLGVHAPMAHGLHRIRRYTVNVVHSSPSRSDIPGFAAFGEVDGIAEVWYDDMASYEAHKASAEGKAWLQDGVGFIGRAATFIVEEKTVIG